MTDMKAWTTPAGWYRDPERPDQQRYWDGQQWTQQVAPVVQQSAPFPPQVPAASKAPVYKRPWFIALAAVFGLMVLGGMLGGGADPTPVTPAADTEDDSARDAAGPAPAAESMSVPDVVGLDERGATAELEDAGLEVSVRREDVDGAEEGEVVQQSPQAGTDADEGSTVTLAVATGVVSVEVPEVAGMKVAAGTDILRAEGFKVTVTKVEDDSVPPGEIVEQSLTGEAEEGDTVSLTVAKAPKPEMTSGQANALRAAENYLAFAPFSRQGLIEQLEFESYSTKDATFAVDHVSVNWNEQAAKAAENYLEMSPFSRQGLIDQLEFEGYTSEQATYGVDKAM